MPNYIYALLCPRGEVRYIGKSNNPEFRLKAHISAAKNHKQNYHSSRWIRSVLRAGHLPTLEVLTEVPDGRSWQEYETHFIKLFRELGFDLTNTQPGGEGSFDTSPEAIAVRVARAAVTKSTPEYREKASKISQGLWADPEIKTKRLAAMAEARLKPGYKDRLSRAQIGSCARPEVKAAKSAAQKASYAKGGRINSLLLPCVTAKRKAGIEKRWANPEEKEKLSLVMRDPKRQAVMQAAAQAPEAKAKRAAKVAITQSTPEFLENQAAKARAQWQDPEFLAKRKAILDARHEATHTPEHLALMRDKRNAKKREKRLREDPAIKAQRLADRRSARKALSQTPT